MRLGRVAGPLVARGLDPLLAGQPVVPPRPQSQVAALGGLPAGHAEDRREPGP